MPTTDKLNILFMASWFPSRKRPTDGNFIQRHAEAVATRHNVEVLHVITDDGLPSHETEWDYTVQKGVGIHIGYIGTSSSSLIKWKKYFDTYKEGWTRLKNKPHLIHLNVIFPAGIFARYFSRKYKVPYIITEHWTGYHAVNSQQTHPLKWKLHQLIAKGARFICPVSTDLKHSMEALHLHGKYHIVPNVVDTEVFYPTTKNPTDLLQLLHVSTLKDEHKNVSGIIRTLWSLLNKKYPVHLTIVGDGDIQPHRELAAQLNIPESAIQFEGAQSPQGIAQFMRAASVFVLFSNYENLPCVILESFATGTPVISTNVGGIAEHFPEEGGVLIAKGDEKELEEAIVHLSQKNTSAEAISQYAIDHFSIEQVSLQFDKLYQICLNS